MFNITINQQVFTLTESKKVVDLLPNDGVLYIACKVNNRLRELTYTISQESDIQLLTLKNYDGTRIYEASLRYLLCMALHNINPKAIAHLNQFISQTISCNFENVDCLINQQFLDKLEQEMKRIIQLDLPIVRKKVSRQDAIAIFKQFNYQDKIELLEYRPDSGVNYYQCGDYCNYMYNYMVPSTGYLKEFKLNLYYPLILLQYPRYDYLGKIPQFQDSPKLSRTLIESDIWSHRSNAVNIANINHHLSDVMTTRDFIHMCETKHNNMLAELGQKIYEQRNHVKIVAIAGPSSSGKTTFCNRLRIELLNKGFQLAMISIDDFYLPREYAPIDEEGKYDFEHIDALDVSLFSKTILSLVSGEEVVLPKFNFKKNKREVGRKVKLAENGIIMIEGLHALNEKLTSLIPRYQKYMVYICPLTQVNIDSNTPIAVTDARLVRRIVRDYYHRNTQCQETLGMWRSVRNGEFKWIYPFQEKADYIFNSELTYEFCILKKYAIPLLEKIPSDHKYFIIANRLIKFLKYFSDIDEKLIPCNSIIKEFIGGSCFES